MAKPELNNDMPFTAKNYKLLLIGLGILVLGYILILKFLSFSLSILTLTVIHTLFLLHFSNNALIWMR